MTDLKKIDIVESKNKIRQLLYNHDFKPSVEILKEELALHKHKHYQFLESTLPRSKKKSQRRKKKRLEHYYESYIRNKEEEIEELIRTNSNFENCKTGAYVSAISYGLAYLLHSSTLGVVYGSYSLLETLFKYIYFPSYVNMVPSHFEWVKKFVLRTKKESEIKKRIQELKYGKSNSTQEQAIDILYSVMISIFEQVYRITNHRVFLQCKEVIQRIFDNKLIDYSQKLYFIVVFIDTNMFNISRKMFAYLLCSMSFVGYKKETEQKENLIDSFDERKIKDIWKFIKKKK